MTLRDVKCLTPAKIQNLEDSIYLKAINGIGGPLAVRVLQSYKVQNAALRSCFAQYWCMDEDHRAMTKQAFCDMHGLTLSQATDLGIFEDAT